ncbi:MAG: (Fe-S)-binding protein [Candidatus Thermoplasmatota archaeon]
MEKKELETCFATSCNFCEKDCPVYQVKKIKTLTARGRNRILLGIFANKVNYSYELMENAYNCTLCGSCNARCALDNTKRVIETRKKVVELGYIKKECKEIVDNVINYGNIYKHKSPGLKENDGIPLYLGCQYREAKPELEKIFHALHEFGINFFVPEEICCGYIIYALGFRKEFEEYKKKFFDKYPYKEVITLCPTCTYFLKNEYGIKVLHGIQILSKEGKGKKVLQRKVTYHDPCDLGRGLGLIEEPRSLLENVGLKLIEMEHNRYFSMCCGAGGGMLVSNPKIAKEISLLRVKEAIDTNTNELITSCPTCELSLFRGVLSKKAKMKVRSIWEVLTS